ncbi:MAG: hypothetical protein ACREHG_05430 [Candidatus Saccharimonadales bacterium]
MNQPIWYRKTEDFLNRYEYATDVVLIVTIAISIYLLFFADSVTKTVWTTYLIMP